jgi:uncharacterized protein (TIGR03435 family)
MVGPYGRQVAGNTTMARLCDLLTNLTERPVIDVTELKGTYEFDLSWTPDEREKTGGKFGMAMTMMGGAPATASSAGPPPPDDASEPGPSLAQALESSYGLKLEARKNPADMVIIDHPEKVPTEN